MKNKKIIIIIVILVLALTFIGGSLAEWIWETTEEERTNVEFTVENDFQCAADGGGDITSGQVQLTPTYCTNPVNAIQRTVKVNPTLNMNDLSISMDLWLNINNIGDALSNSQNFKYALTTYSDSCTTGVISSGTFNGKNSGSTVNLLDNKIYSSTMTDTYYLYIWLDYDETNNDTMNQSFNFSLGGVCDTSIDSTLDSVETLQEKYDFQYYSTMKLAVQDVNNNTVGTNADSDSSNAVAGVYVDNGQPNVVLLKDALETERSAPSVDMTINLGGHTLSSTGPVAIDSLSGNVTLDGRLSGSKIEIINNEGQMARAIQHRTGGLTVNGGTYMCSSKDMTGICIYSDGNMTINDVNVVSINTGNSGSAYGVYILANGNAVINNSQIRGLSNYNYADEESGNYYQINSIGIGNVGTLTINNTYVLGTHSGMSSSGTLYVNGGIFESYGHGGIYFNGTGKKSYVRNATIRDCDMPEGYTATANNNGAGFYIGGGSERHNITVYMNNCDIYGRYQPIVLRGSSGELNNTLYISLSRINTDHKIRIDNDTHKLYSGIGNNFTAANTNLPSAFIQTGEIYTIE